MHNRRGDSDEIVPVQPLTHNSTDQWFVVSIQICYAHMSFITAKSVVSVSNIFEGTRISTIDT